MIAGEIVDTHALLQLIWVSLAAGLVLVAVMSLAIVSYARAAHARREHNATLAGTYFALAVAATGGIVITVVLGITIMLEK